MTTRTNDSTPTTVRSSYRSSLALLRGPVAALMLVGSGALASATPAAAAITSGPSISIGGLAITEGNGAQTSMPFTVALSAISSAPVSAHFQTFPNHSPLQPGDATPGASCASGVDYIAVDQIITIPANANPPQITVNVPICGDTLNEGGEIVSAQVSDIQGAFCLELCASWATILDDDNLPGLSVSNSSQTEGSGGGFLSLPHHVVFPVTLSAASSRTVTVNYNTAAMPVFTKQQAVQAAVGGTACGGATDYLVTAGTLTFNPGETSKSVSVTICGDTTPELNENFQLMLSNPANATLIDGTALGTIIDDD